MNHSSVKTIITTFRQVIFVHNKVTTLATFPGDKDTQSRASSSPLSLAAQGRERVALLSNSHSCEI
jgi:hypothetical protein